MVMGIFYKFLSGAIITSAVVYPALDNPKGFLEAVTGWIASISPVLTDAIGGVI